MKRVGEIVRTAQGLAIVRSSDDSHPRIGTELLDSDLETVGRVVDVFGPVDGPYIAVSPDRNVPLATLLGEKLYAR
ncbi:MAG: H/ACA ribonucleoprotein complex subunit GAR1 [Halobacteriota archaeon]|uniref:H/ACA ribonucleoprotein complex subunit GAR1 n=1 Tax=Natronomonas sp. TaxID=2184060 RepID=UPI003976D1EF